MATNNLRFVFLLVLAIFLLPGLSLSQSGTTGAIGGKVVDDQGSPLPGAQVKLSSPDLIGGDQVKLTNAEGRYRFPAIPRGSYALEASLPGFEAARKDNIRVFVGESLTVDLVLSVGKLAQEVTVTGQAPIIDIKDSQMNATNLDLQTLQNVGQQQRWKSSTDLINLAPGVVNGSVMGGNASTSIQWQIEGQSLITYMGDGAPVQYPDIDILEEVKVSGSGANAEYGSFTGAMLNMITKSGGNVFEGLVSLSYSPMSWSQKNFDPADPLYSVYQAPPRVMYFDLHAGLGGPIIKDKIWFYISGGTIRDQTEVKGVGKERSQIPKGFGKVTYQIGRKDRLSAFMEYEYYHAYDAGLSYTRPLEATVDGVSTSYPIGLNYLRTFNENTFAEIRLGYYYYYYERLPKNGRDVPQRYDYLTGMYSGNDGLWLWNLSGQVNASVTVTHHAEEFLKGSHDFKVGVEFMRGKDNFDTHYTGGFQYTDNYPYSFVYEEYRNVSLAYTYGYNILSNGWKAAAFAQDSWTIGSRLTINAGVRWSRQRGYLPHLQAEAFWKPVDYIEPRIGFTFDLFGDHTTVLKAHYGRFHESLKTWTFNAVDPGYLDWVGYEVLANGDKVELWRVPYSSPATFDPKTGIQYSDQFTLGLERTIFKDASAGVTFISRTYANFTGRCNMTGTYELGPYTYTDPDGNQQTIQVYRQTNPSADDLFMITNPRAGLSPTMLITPKNTYRGLSFTFNKRFSAGWMLHVDYTYSRARGNMINTSSASWGTDYFENPNRQINSYGNLNYDAPHALDVYGTFSLPLGLNFSPRFTWMSGSNWTPYVQVADLAGRPSVLLTARGSERLPARTALDLRLEKVFSLSGRHRIGLIVDAFNVFNRGVPTGVYAGENRANYGKASSVCAPRFFRVGARYYF